MPLYLVATPIGNLEDVTLRALRILKEADLIACEDTRHSRRLLDHYGISRPTISYHEHNERARAAELTERLLRGENIAVITDAGMPGISDPAYRLVTAAIEQGVGVIPIPGPTALITGLVASGLPTDSFLFVGFLPAKRQARRAKLESLRTARETLVAYEAPHRIQETLLEAREVLGDRQAALARELTKLHEQFIRGTLSEISAQFDAQGPRGEMTLVIAGCGDEDLGTGMLPPEARSLREQINHLVLTQGLSRNEALKQTARRHGLSKKEAYRLMLAEEPSGNEGREEDQPPEKESDDRER
ncbi:MAG TPA: 16S rRNA (cytidine(1402)-2'-O)-methyltransferase [Blastocatellia bacterium]|nr:16S rRNA (cytidine(1402)-2'-O)-methyltransferase [Blastocatellia bacterium]